MARRRRAGKLGIQTAAPAVLLPGRERLGLYWYRRFVSMEIQALYHSFTYNVKKLGYNFPSNNSKDFFLPVIGACNPSLELKRGFVFLGGSSYE
jgi:hypothetical protein